MKILEPVRERVIQRTPPPITDAWLKAEDERIYRLRTQGQQPESRKQFRLIDTFAGAGGMTLGFSPQLGHSFKPVWANDFDGDCVATYKANFGDHCVHGDIVDILQDSSIQIPEADVVIGGPPCQGFSLLNKKRKGDPRKQLWRPYFDIVERSGASVFVMENVPQLLGSREHSEILNTADAMGFKVWGDVLCSADYGVPQIRRRAIIIGCKFFDPSKIHPPRKTHFDPSQRGRANNPDAIPDAFLPGALPWPTVREAIGDLPPPVGTQIRSEAPPLDIHFGRSPTPLSKARYRAIPDEGMNRFDLQRIAPELTPKCWIRKKSGGTDLFGRLWWDRPSVTIRTEFYKPEKGRYLHPSAHRPITHREAARLQSFPDHFRFCGTKIQIAKQIGNAVPPLLAARIADVVYLLLSIKNRA